MRHNMDMEDLPYWVGILPHLTSVTRTNCTNGMQGAGHVALCYFYDALSHGSIVALFYWVKPRLLWYNPCIYLHFPYQG